MIVGVGHHPNTICRQSTEHSQGHTIVVYFRLTLDVSTSGGAFARTRLMLYTSASLLIRSHRQRKWAAE